MSNLILTSSLMKAAHSCLPLLCSYLVQATPILHGQGADPAPSGHDHAAEAKVVEVDSYSRYIVNLQVETIPETTLSLSRSLYGYLKAPAHAMQTYSLPCSGRIHLLVKSAQAVKKGDVLYKLTSPIYADQAAAVESAEADLKRCKMELSALRERTLKLSEVGAKNSELEAQFSFKLAETARAERELSIAQTRLRSLAPDAEQTTENGLPVLLIRAQTDGIVNDIAATQNSWGEQGASVITMSDPAAMEIVGSLYAADTPRIAEVHAFLPVGRENVQLTGTWRLSDQVNAGTQTRSLYFTPSSLPQEARAGQLCRIDLYNAPAEPGMVSIPESALVRVGTDDVVFIELKEGKYAMVKVHAGESHAGMVSVAGLKPGQKIVVKGGYELKYSIPSATGLKKVGHFHADGKFHEADENDGHEEGGIKEEHEHDHEHEH